MFKLRFRNDKYWIVVHHSPPQHQRTKWTHHKASCTTLSTITTQLPSTIRNIRVDAIIYRWLFELFCVDILFAETLGVESICIYCNAASNDQIYSINTPCSSEFWNCQWNRTFTYEVLCIIQSIFIQISNCSKYTKELFCNVTMLLRFGWLS